MFKMLSFGSKLIDETDIWIVYSSEFLFPLKQSSNQSPVPSA